ncbi:MAG: Gfo/Idh/MocA family protein, partial [Candidatus Bathyarchaeia archaeon]
MAVVGTGSWGQNHVRVYNELPETELVAVCDVNPERSQAVAEKFDVKGYTDSGKLLKREDVEAVSICVWSTKLAEEAVKALESGKHVLAEKPMASNVQQAEKIVDLARRNDLRLMVGFIERFNGVQ